MNNNHLLTRQIEEYIAYKQGLGFKIFIESQELRRFAKYAVECGHYHALTVDLALRWASLDSNYSRWYMARRLETIHTFAKYAVVFDPKTEIPPTGVFGKCHGRTTPYIISESEINLLMHRARQLLSPDGLRAITIATALGLLWSTGLRPSELCNLLIKDVDLDYGVLLIRETKYRKDRYVPLHSRTSEALSQYSAKRALLCPTTTSEHFFLSTNGKPIKLRNLEYAMQVIRPCLLPEGEKEWSLRAPRLYDLRHSFACNTIKRWLEDNEDVNHKMVVLSAYMGHIKPKDTYWYLTGTPELFALSGSKYERFVGSFYAGDDHEK